MAWNCLKYIRTLRVVNGRNSSSFTIEGVRKVKEIKIPVPWGHISGKWWGNADQRPLLALHGWQDNAGTFDRLIPLLPEDISVLAVDLPGHGLSSWYPSSLYYNPQQLLTTIRMIVMYFNWENVSILGHSMGSELAFLYTAIYPEETKTLIGLDIIKPLAVEQNSLAERAESIIDKALEMVDFKRDSSPKYDYSELVARLLKGYKGSLTKDCCEILLKRGKVKFDDGKYYYTRDPRLHSTTSFLSRYPHRYLMKLASNVNCDVLNIKGKPGMSFDDPNHYKEALNVVKKSAKRFEFHKVEGSHHFHLSNPVPTAEVIAQFLRNT